MRPRGGISLPSYRSKVSKFYECLWVAALRHSCFDAVCELRLKQAPFLFTPDRIGFLRVYIWSMVKANELRIGNWLHLKNSDHIKVDADNIADIINNPAIFDPIQLSPEILEACGFVKDGEKFLIPSSDWDKEDDYIPAQGNVSIYYDESDKSCNFQNGCGLTEYRLGVPLFYVHQLQNAWFSLTGQELQVNIPVKV